MNIVGLSKSNEKIQATKKKKKENPLERKGDELHHLITTTLDCGNLREAIRLPIGEDINEWLAVNTIDFYNQINILYTTLDEYCTPISCPLMNAGSKYEYRWADGITVQKPIEVSAPEYIKYFKKWVEAQIDNKTIFPHKLGEPFPSKFKDTVKVILKRLFRVYAHIYHSHFQEIISLAEEAHLNTSFKHFVLFVSEYELIDREELGPLDDVVEHILRT